MEYGKLPMLTAAEREILRFAAAQVQPIRPVDVCSCLYVCDKTARTLLKGLVEKKLLQPASGGKLRVRSYRSAADQYKTSSNRQQC